LLVAGGVRVDARRAGERLAAVESVAMSEPIASERIARTLLGIVYNDLTALSGGIDDARQVMKRLQAMLDEQGDTAEAQLDNLTALIGELDLPAEVTEVLREIADSRRGQNKMLSELLPIGMLDGAIGYIETRQKMIRDQGFDVDSE
jgi:hypothetical protein